MINVNFLFPLTLQCSGIPTMRQLLLWNVRGLGSDSYTYSHIQAELIAKTIKALKLKSHLLGFFWLL